MKVTVIMVYTCQDLISRYDVQTSNHPFVQLVREKMLVAEEEIARKAELIEKQNKMSSLDNLTVRVAWMERLSGFGFLSSSLYYSNHSGEMEAFWCAAAANAFKEADVNVLVIPIDEFYLFEPQRSIGLVGKTKVFDQCLKDSGIETRYAIILSDFSDSQVFSKETVERIPSQGELGLYSPYKEIGCLTEAVGGSLTRSLLKDGKVSDALSALVLDSLLFQRRSAKSLKLQRRWPTLCGDATILRLNSMLEKLVVYYHLEDELEAMRAGVARQNRM